MNDLEITLMMPSEIGAYVISRSDIQSLLDNHPEVRIASFSSEEATIAAYHDFGATVIALMGTVAGAAAVKGIFDLIKTVVTEVCKTRREKRSQEHEIKLLMLKTGAKEHIIDLSESIEKIVSQLSQIQAQLA